MARFRRYAGAEWQQGLPLGWRDWAIKPEVGAETHYFGGPWRQHNFPEEHSSAVVHHGEQRYGLEVMPVRSLEPRPNKHPGLLGPNGMWAWAIFKHDHTNPDKPWLFPSVWSSTVENPPAKYYGFTNDPEEARREAEENWELHKQHSGMGDYDINDIMRDHDPRAGKPSRGPDEDYGDIFGDGGGR